MSTGKDGQFNLVTEYEPAGDQPVAIDALVNGLAGGMSRQTLLGVTGSGKTFTMANVIARVQKPTLVIAHNKTLAAQLAQEFQEYFPDNAVHYFVSYYDYYQPEAYLPVTDTYIEKDAQINEEIDRLRHASTQSLLTRRDVIIVASVSCIYGLGSPEEYEKEHLMLAVGDRMERNALLRKLVGIFFERTNADLTPGTFRALGNRVEIMPVQERVIYEVEIGSAETASSEPSRPPSSGATRRSSGAETSETGSPRQVEGPSDPASIDAERVGRDGLSCVRSITVIDPVSRVIMKRLDSMFLFPAKHFLTETEQKKRAVEAIRLELAEQLGIFEKQGRLLEAERLKRRTNYDLAMMEEIGYCSGIENYSRHLSGRKAGEAPDTLLEYFPRLENGAPDFLTFIDESHVTIPQLRGMYAGDASRKRVLIEHGFRLPSALDNRPLRWEEFDTRVGQLVYVSATPGEFERETSERIAEQVIRPTGLIDPAIDVRPVRMIDGGYAGQVQDFIAETREAVDRGGRVIATTLTKKMAEDFASYLKEQGVKAEYLHSDIKTIERIRILTAFRKGEFDCLVGVNLLREGLDLPEVSLIGIFDADREGFLRSETSLIQIIGRAARNVDGRVILYADQETRSLERAIGETNRRRSIQLAYNVEHGITPQTIRKKIHDITEAMESDHDKAVRADLALDAQVFGRDRRRLITLKKRQMKEAVKEWDFETAALLRDEIRTLEESK